MEKRNTLIVVLICVLIFISMSIMGTFSSDLNFVPNSFTLQSDSVGSDVSIQSDEAVELDETIVSGSLSSHTGDKATENITEKKIPNSDDKSNSIEKQATTKAVGVCNIGDTAYATLKAAVTGAVTGDTIYINSSHTSQGFNITGKALTILPADDVDCVVTFSSSVAVDAVNTCFVTNSDLTLGAENMTGTLSLLAQANSPTLDSGAGTSTRRVIQLSNGTLTMFDGVTIANGRLISVAEETSAAGAGIRILNAEFNMYGGTVKDCYISSFKNAYGAGVQIAGGTFNMYDGAITGMKANYASNGSGKGVGVGLVKDSNAVFNLYGGSITHGFAKYPVSLARGIGVGVGPTTTFNMYGGEIAYNDCEQDNDPGQGSGVYINGTGQFNMYNGSIHHNTIHRLAGTRHDKDVRGLALCIDGGNGNLYGGSIVDNVGYNALSYANAAPSKGVAVTCLNNATVKIGSGEAYTDGNGEQRISQGMYISNNSLQITGAGGGTYSMADGAAATSEKVHGFGVYFVASTITIYGKHNIEDSIYLSEGQLITLPADKTLDTRTRAYIHTEDTILGRNVMQYEDEDVSLVTMYRDSAKFLDFTETYFLAPSVNEIDDTDFIEFGTMSYVTLTIEKAGSNIDPNQMFVFDIIDSLDRTITIAIKGKGRKTIVGLIPDEYTVRERKDWSWRYTPTNIEQSVVLDSNKTVTFNNTKSDDRWESMFDRIKNTFLTS